MLFGTRIGKPAFIFDIGSSSVGAAAVMSQRDGTPFVAAQTRVQMPLEESVSFERFLALAEKSILEAGKRIAEESKQKPSSIHCFLASPWYAAQTRMVAIERERPFIFDRRALDASVAEESKRFKDEASREEAKLLKGAHVIEEKVIDIKVNGYRVEAPLGRETRRAEYAFHVALAPEQALKRFGDAFHKLFPAAVPKFHTFLLPYYAVAKAHFSRSGDFLLVDVGGEVTDVALVRDGLLLQSASFPRGRNFLYRRLAAARKSALAEAESLMKLLVERKVDADTRKEVAKLLTPIRDEWAREFRFVMTEQLKASFLPEDVILLSDGEVASWFSECIKGEEYAQYTLSARPFSVSTPSGSALASYVKAGATIQERDRFLSIEAMYLHRFEELRSN